MVELKDFGENNVEIKLRSIQEEKKEQKEEFSRRKKGTDTPHPNLLPQRER